MRWLICLWLITHLSMPLWAQTKVAVGVVQQPYTARTGADEFSPAPGLLFRVAQPLFEQWRIELGGVSRVVLSAEEQQQYGVWHRLGLADGHLSRAVAAMVQDSLFVLGLLGNCNSSLGMLAGLQNPGTGEEPVEVGLIWLDAHGDFNTPETTLSGWLGGMPVAVAAGLCLHRLRNKAGLRQPIAPGNIVMMGLRDVDPLEQELIDSVGITVIPAGEMTTLGPRFRQAVEELAQRVDVIYLHIDLDILDAADIPGSFFEVENGPRATELVAPVRYMTARPKVQALGISSFPTREEGRERSLQSAMMLLEAGLAGLHLRDK